MFEDEDEFCIFCEEEGCVECIDRKPLCVWCEGIGCDQCAEGDDAKIKYEISQSGWSQLTIEPSAVGAKLDISREPSFDVLDHDLILRERQRIISYVMSWLCCTESDADLLLRYYRYNLKTLENVWFEDPKAARLEAGVCGHVLEDEKTPDMVQCEAYCSVVKREEAHRLSCGHWLCNDCWEGFLDYEMSAGVTATLARCPAMDGNKKCRELVTLDTCRKYLDEDNLNKLIRWILTAFVDSAAGLKWCPSPGCSYAVQYSDLGGIKDVKCDCGHRFCFTCMHAPHGPCPCDLVKRWNSETGANAQDIATQKLIAATAKQCPNCQTWITKDRHCNHMKCTKCSHHFCWLCLAPFTRETGHNDYYKCTVYNEKMSRGEVSSEEKRMLESNLYLQKLILHQNQFDDCDMDMKRMQQKLKELEKIKEANPLMGAAWLKDAMLTIIESYRALQWTYVMMYFMQSSSRKELFGKHQEALRKLVNQADIMLEQQEEYEQEQLEKRKSNKKNHSERKLVNQADIMLEQQEEIAKVSVPPILKLVENKRLSTSVSSLVRRVKKNIDVLMEISASEFEDLLQYKPDQHSSKWACVACTAANDDHYEAGSRGRVTKCAMCGACRAHGEPDCRVPSCGIHPKTN